MKARALFLCAAALALASPRLEAEDAAPFALDPKAGKIDLLVKKKGFLKAFAHDHDMVAPVYTGSIAWMPEEPERSSVRIEIDTREIVVGDSELSAGDKATVQERMRGPDVLDVSKFPRVTFVSQSVVVHARDARGRTPLSVLGTLTLHGVARQTTLDVVLEDRQSERTVVVTGEHVLKQSDHGIEPFSSGFGAVAVQDDVTVAFTIVARRPDEAKDHR